MVLTISLGDQMVSRTHTLTMMTTTTGTIKVTALSATDVEAMDVSSAPDMDINTEMPLSEITDIPSRLDSVMATPMLILETSQDHLTTNTDTESVEDIPRDGPMDMVADTVSVTDTDMVLPTDGPPTTVMDTETQAQRDP